MKYWKIKDFVDEIRRVLQGENLHINTVDGWFKKLEEERIHYISRTEDTNEKIYDERDLEIAVFIKTKRNEKWSLSGIFREIGNHFELRPFPLNEKESTYAPQTVDMVLKSNLLTELKDTFEEVAATQLIVLKEHYQSLLKQLPKPKSSEEEREERFQEMVIRKRVESFLEEEAYQLWSTKPENDRIKKVGWFKSEEDRDKRERFIKQYINENFSERLRQELGLNE